MVPGSEGTERSARPDPRCTCTDEKSRVTVEDDAGERRLTPRAIKNELELDWPSCRRLDQVARVQKEEHA